LLHTGNENGRPVGRPYKPALGVGTCNGTSVIGWDKR